MHIPFHEIFAFHPLKDIGYVVSLEEVSKFLIRLKIMGNEQFVGLLI